MKKNLIIIFMVLSLFININILNIKAADNGYLIKTNPSGAAVYLNGNYVGITPYRLVNSNGNSLIRISKGGYLEVTKNITLSSGEETIELTKLQNRSILFITSNPTQIFYTFKEIIRSGGTPTVIDNLEAGNYTITFSKDGYKDIVKKVSLNGGLTYLKIDLEAGTSEPTTPVTPTNPEKTYTSVNVTTNVDACQIYLDGVYKGKSPLTLNNLEVGKTYKVSAYKDGYNSDYKNYKVVENGSVSFELSKITIKYTTLTIKSNVPGSTMYINGAKYVGTSITISDLKVGSKVTVKISKDGYASQTKTITLANSGNLISFNLQKVVSVIVGSSPEGALVMISKNGLLTKMGTTPVKLEGLIVGNQYTIVLQKSGYKSVNFTYTVKENDAPLIFNLKPLG